MSRRNFPPLEQGEDKPYDPTLARPVTRDSADSSLSKQVVYWQAEQPETCWALQGGGTGMACPMLPVSDIGLCIVHYEEILGKEWIE